MKKIGTLILGLFVMIVFSVCFGCSAGGGNNGGGGYTEGTTTNPESSIYEQITTTMDFSNKANSSSEFYMFVYNKGTSDINDTTSYEGILEGGIASIAKAQRSVPGRSVLGAQNATPASYAKDEYNCGLSLFSGRALPSLESVNARSALYSTYERDKNKAAANVGDRDSFYITKSDKADEDIKATCCYVDSVCQIFVQDGVIENGIESAKNYYSERTDVYSIEGSDGTVVTKKGVEYIAEKFNAIYDAEQNLLGSINLDELSYSNIIATSDRITILIADLKVLSDKTATLGYSYSSDLYTNETASNGQPLRSNKRLMFTLNTEGFSSGFGKEQLANTLGHEFNHMINFIQKTLYSRISAATVLDNDAWFTEMLSAITEDFIPNYMKIENTVQKSRIPRFLGGTQFGMYDWRDLYSYGFAYAFGAYLVRNYGGAKLVKEMAQNSSYGTAAITAALKALGYNETYDSVLQKFGLVLTNADGKDTKNPTLNKDGTSSYKNYAYKFAPIDLYSYDAKLPINEEISEYDNPHWSSSNHKGPCFYKISEDSNGNEYINFPNSLAAGAFYTVYLGKASEWDYGLSFAPPTNNNIKAYIYLRN